MTEKIYNPHCPKWRECEKRRKDDCICENNMKASFIMFKKIVDKMFGSFDNLNNNEELQTMLFLKIVLDDFVEKYNDESLEEEYCTFFTDDGCLFDDKISCIEHFKKYYIKHYIEA